MNFTCDSCHNDYTIADDKLPSGKILAFPCPDCGARIELDLRGDKAGKVPQSRKSQTPTPEPPPEGATDEPGSAEDLKNRILQNLAELPPMPQVVFKAHAIMDDPDSDARQVAELIETDQAIATKVLKLANSAYYGLSGKVSSIQHASVVLGYKALRELITLAGTSSLLGSKLYGYDMDSGTLWRHSMTVAFGSKIIAHRQSPELENDAFSAGLIHDVGKLVLDRLVLNRKSRFDEYLASGDKSFLSAENRILGFDHAEIGYEICLRWQIPEKLATAIRYHHQMPAEVRDQLAVIVAMANNIAVMGEALSMVGQIENGIDAVMYMADDDLMAGLGLAHEDIGAIMNEALEAVAKISREVEPA